MNITPQTLSTAAAAITAVENASLTMTTPPTNQQKLDAAISFASAIDPQISAWAVPAELLINALVGVFNKLGIFHHSTPA